MTHTSYSNYTDLELLSLLENKRLYSPVIDELCNRIEQQLRTDYSNSNILAKVTCPVCEAVVKISEDTGNDNYTLLI